MSGLKGALEELKTAACDLASLEVQTYVGKVDISQPKDSKGAAIKVTKFEDYLKAQIGTPSDLALVAVTKMNFDGDAINLVPNELVQDHVLKAHDAAVKAGIETRHGLLALFGSILGLKADK